LDLSFAPEDLLGTKEVIDFIYSTAMLMVQTMEIRLLQQPSLQQLYHLQLLCQQKIIILIINITKNQMNMV
jgi:hypothetical protein